MDIEEAIEEMKSLSPSEAAIEIVLRELESYKRRYELALEQNVKDYKNSIPKKKVKDKKQWLEEIKTKKGEIYVDA